jgi:hypothetical protein
MIDLPSNFTAAEISINSLLTNLLIGTLLSLILTWHYLRSANHKFIRRDIGFVLPILCLTTLLIIVVVKSSLALSLGLVGALSIVRFRTPIKEPEELAYIFLSIAVGLALGANQVEVVCVSIPVILIIISVINYFKKSKTVINNQVILNLEVDGNMYRVDDVLSLIETTTSNSDIRRIDEEGGKISLVCFINLNDKRSLINFCQKFKSNFEGGRYSIIDEGSSLNH